MSKAPDFHGTYPSGGEIVGPLWQRLWDVMEPGEWMSVEELVKHTAGNSSTIRNLLRKAVKGTTPVQQYREPTYPNRSLYRRRTGRPAPPLPDLPAPRKRSHAAVLKTARRLDAVLQILLNHDATGLTKSEWTKKCQEELGLSRSTADRAVNSLLDQGRAGDMVGALFNRSYNHSLVRYRARMPFEPLPLDTPDQGV